MFSNNVGVAGSGCDGQFLRQQVPEPARVQVGAGADDAVLGQPADLPRHVCEHIHWVARDQKDRVWTVF